MKILEAQESLVCNYEVHKHMLRIKRKYKERPPGRQTLPGNLAVVQREVLSYLEHPASPFSQKPLTYKDESVKELVDQLKPYKLTKSELLMILNLRPVYVATLNACVEDMSERYTLEEQNAIVEIVVRVLGKFPDDDQADGEGDQDNGEASRTN